MTNEQNPEAMAPSDPVGAVDVGDGGVTSQPDPEPLTQSGLDRQRLQAFRDLRSEKLRFEVRELRHWWRRPGAISAVATITIGLAGFFSALYVGYFDKARLEFERTTLLAQIQQLKENRDEIERNLKRLSQAPSPSDAALLLKNEENAALSARNRELEVLIAKFQEANQAFSTQNEELRSELTKAGAESTTLADQVRQLSGEKGKLERKVKSQFDELALLPAQLKDCRLTYSESSTEAHALLAGANLGDGPGRIWIRIARIKRTLMGRVQFEERKDNVILEMEAAPSSVQSWTSREIALALGPVERNKILEARRSVLGKNADLKPEELTFGPDIGIQFRVETNLGAKTDWALAELMYTLRTIP
jgi:hypothetical protein